MADSRARAGRWLASCAAALAIASQAGAQVIYGEGRVGVEIGKGASDGANAVDQTDASGSDDDISPLYGLAVGFEVPLHEVLPADWSLAEWYARAELEWLGGRDLQFVTGGSRDLFSFVTGWTLMQNFWLDFPLERPVEALVGRRMRFLRFLEPWTFSVGGGIGGASLHAKVTDNTQFGEDPTHNFAWQVGASTSFELAEGVTLSLLNYRYVDLGKVKPGLFVAGFSGPFSLDLTSHEVFAGLRWDFYRLPFSMRSDW
jgi:opacity protein-like surface antigen